MTTLGTFGYDASAANEYQYDTIGSGMPTGRLLAWGRICAPVYGILQTETRPPMKKFWVGASTYLNPSSV